MTLSRCLCSCKRQVAEVRRCSEHIG